MEIIGLGLGGAPLHGEQGADSSEDFVITSLQEPGTSSYLESRGNMPSL